MSKTIWVVILIIIVAIVGYMYWGQSSDTTETDDTTTPTVTDTENETTEDEGVIDTPDSETVETTPTPDPQTPPSEAKSFTVEGSEFTFNTPTLAAAPGQKVMVTFKNTGKFPHDFVIDGVVNSGTVNAAGEKVIEFTAPAKAGSYPIYCSVGNHREQGMEAMLVVE